MEVLIADKVSKVYESRKSSINTHALHNVNLVIHEGEFVAVMGPSGCGKTTLLNILSGVDRKYTGQIEISGIKLNGMTEEEIALFRRRRLGYILQDFQLLDSLTLKENIMLPLVLDRKEAGEMNRKANEVLSLLGIESIQNQYPTYVSGGQQQRAAICRAIIHDPAIILADEPTGNLDTRSTTAVMQCLTKLNSNLRSTILLVTHDPFAASYSGRMILMKDGAIVSEVKRGGDDRKAYLDRIMEKLVLMGED